MGQRFAFVTEEEINLLVDKAVPENNIRSKLFDGKLFVNEILKLVVTFSFGLNSVQQSLN